MEIEYKWFEEAIVAIKQLIPVLGTDFSVEPGWDEGFMNGLPFCLLWVEINWEGSHDKNEIDHKQNILFGNAKFEKEIPNKLDLENKTWVGTKKDAKECADRLEKMLKESLQKTNSKEIDLIRIITLPVNKEDERVVDMLVNKQRIK
jgi:hypothetical protein